MRGILSVLAALAVIGLAFWAYRETHLTQRSLAELRQVQFEVSTLREAMGVQRAEWAYLNRPTRLRELAELNFDRLGLMPLSPNQFGNMDQVAYPVPVLPAFEQPVETFGEIGEIGEATALAGTLPDDATTATDELEP